MTRFVFILLALILLISGCIPIQEVEAYDASRVSPATKEAIEDFLICDNISENVYSWPQYNCLNFAIDLWRNAYQEGFDTFLVITDTNGVFSHVCLGFYAEDGNYSDSTYWFDRNGGCWFYVDPQKDYVYSRYSPEDIYGESTIEIITFIYGEDAFALCQESTDMFQPIKTHLYIDICFYKIRGLLFQSSNYTANTL